MNSVVRMGPANTARPTAAGAPTINTQRSAQSIMWEKARGSAWPCFSDRLGRITVARAIPNTPSGNSIMRSDKYSQVTLPDTRKDAIRVSNSRLICMTEEPKMPGNINFITLRTPG